MDANQKLAEIETIEDQASDIFDRLMELSRDADSEVRYRALECFELIGIPDVINTIRAALDDSDELVRVAALEFLGAAQDDHSARNIEGLLNDEDPLVRSAAAISLGDIGNAGVDDKLLSRLLTEDDDEVRIPVYAALYTLGHDGYLEKVLEGLKNEYYRVRCVSANLLANIDSSAADKSKALEALHTALKKEETVAVSSSINNAISRLSSPV